MALVTIVYSLLISVAMGSIHPGFFVKTIQICSSVIHKSVIFLFLSSFPTQKTLHDLRARFLSESGNCECVAVCYQGCIRLYFEFVDGRRGRKL